MTYQDLGSAGIGLQLGAGIGSAYGAWASGKANRTLRRFEASVADAQAQAALARGQFAANQSDRRTAQVASAQRTSYAGQGVVVGKGSAADVAAETEVIGAADRAQIRANAAMEAWGYTAQAGSLRMQGVLENAQGQQQATADLLTAGARGAGDFYRLRDNGGGPAPAGSGSGSSAPASGGGSSMVWL